MNKAAQIAALIASGTFTEEDRAWLEARDENKIKGLHGKLTGNAATPPTPPPAPAPVPNPAGGGVTGNADWRQLLPADVLEFVDEATAEGKKKRQELIDQITANTAGCPHGSLDPARLANEKLDVLKVLAFTTAPKAAPAPATPAGPDYRGLGVVPPTRTGNSTPPPPAYIPPVLFAQPQK